MSSSLRSKHSSNVVSNHQFCKPNPNGKPLTFKNDHEYKREEEIKFITELKNHERFYTEDTPQFEQSEPALTLKKDVDLISCYVTANDDNKANSDINIYNLFIGPYSANELISYRKEHKFELWLKEEVQLPQYYPQLAKHGLDTFDAITTTNMEQLKHTVGIEPVGHRQQLMKHIKQLDDYDDQTEQKYHNPDEIYFYFKFPANFSQLQCIHDTIIRDTVHHTRYFAVKSYFKVDNNTKEARNKDLTDDMDTEQEYLLFPKLPKQRSDKALFASCMNHLFSSNQLMIQEYVYDKLQFPQKMKDLLKYKAKSKLKLLYDIAATQKPSYLPKTTAIHLKSISSGQIKFHTLYVVHRPSKFTMSHWVLKFEGNSHLLTIQFSESNTVHIQLMENRRKNRRIFFYWWIKQSKQKYYTKRWSKLITKFIKTSIGADIIGVMIETWSKTNLQYDLFDNNCQHFVADIMAAISYPIAEILLSRFDAKLATVPVAPIGIWHGIDCNMRIHEVNSQLTKAMKDYWISKKQPRNSISISVGIGGNVLSNKQEEELFQIYQNNLQTFLIKMSYEMNWQKSDVDELKKKFENRIRDQQRK